MSILSRSIVSIVFITQSFIVSWSLASDPTAASAPTDSAPAFSADDLDFFEKKIRPVLVRHCEECHSAAAAKSNRLKGGLLVDSRDGLLKGGESGAAVVPSNVEDSLLIQAMRYESLQMPPQGKLPANVIADFERWIARGMADPRRGLSAVDTKKRIDLVAGRQHWAYRPLLHAVTPVVSNSSSDPRSPIDAFVMNRLQSDGFRPAPEARPVSLIRRTYFDLVGLPPEPEQIDEFTADDRPDAFERIVDRLLASPQFGERWSRHWLSVVRFGESMTLRGFIFPEAWRYRDYVIDAFNSDLPYDRFVIEQIAGDLLPAESLAETQRQKIATTFLALGNNNLEEQDKQQLRMDVVDEQLEAICKGFLAQTVGCARCHDHKFDPIPTRDYYAMAGILANVKTLEEANVSTWLELPLPVEPEREAIFARQEATLSELQSKIKAVTDAQKKLTSPASDTTNSGDSSERKDANQLSDQLKQLKKELQELSENGPQRPKYMSVTEEKQIDDIPVHIRGTVHNLGEKVPRGFLQVLDFHEAKSLPASQSGRKEFGEWIVHRDNPLAARVISNRVWHWLMKSGLSRSPDNFGTTGDKPVHGELLDRQAGRFLEKNGSLKEVIREIVLSHTYRQASDANINPRLSDPENRLLSHANRNRLDAECLLDAILTISGQRVDQLGGRTIVGRATEDYGYMHTSRRRAVYWPVFRNSLPEIFEAFDFADPSIPTGGRSVSTVATQSLFFLNNPWVESYAQYSAQRILDQPERTDENRIERAFRMTLGRPPSAREMQIASETLISHDSREKAWTGLFKALFASIDFRYVE